MKEVILTTVFSGYNYGSSLQALAGKTILKEMGYDCHLVAQKSLVKGRDIRLKKLLTILIRSYLLHGNNDVKPLRTYKSSYSKSMIGDSVNRFSKFTNEYLNPEYLSWRQLQCAAKNAVACFAGSDQIWNSSTMYIDPMYYLRFAPMEKRVAFAPSFGRDFMADYNKKKMCKWISEFAHLSIREDSGMRLIKELIGRDATQLVDPTLLIDNKTWKKILGIKDIDSNYILAYFLDTPSDVALKAIAEVKEMLKSEVIAIPYQFNDMSFCDKTVPAGPIEFLDLINNAKCVLTDSFHGTAFSINLHTPFYVFSRTYGTAHSQNSRVESILKKMKMEDRFDPHKVTEQINNLNFDYSEQILNAERKKAKEYILNSLKQ